jgi:hypothetical protein
MKRAFWTLLWILTATIICSAQTTFYFPHVTNGVLGGTIWKTTIFLANPAATGTASGTITFKQEDSNLAAAGAVFNTIAFVDQDGAAAGSGGTITFSVPAGQTRKYTSTGAGAYAGGFATVVTTAGSVNGTAVFSEFDLANRLIGEAGVPQASALANQAIFVDTVGGFNIGVAFANPGIGAADVNLSLLNSAGATVASTTRALGSGNHLGIFTSQLFTTFNQQLAGSMQLRSSVPLTSIALRFDPSFSIFTTLPPVSIASLITPALNWFEKRPGFAPLVSVARLLGAFQVRLG